MVSGKALRLARSRTRTPEPTRTDALLNRMSVTILLRDLDVWLHATTPRFSKWLVLCSLP